MTRSASRLGDRVAARLAVGALGVLVAAAAAFLVDSRGVVLVVGLLVGLGTATTVALGWWAFTTRRAWKRRLNVVLAAAVAVTIVLAVATISLRYGAGVVAVAVLALVYSAASRAALDRYPGMAATGVRVGAVAGTAPPVHPWLLVNPRSGDGTATRTGLVAAALHRGLHVRVLEPGDDAAALARDAVADGADALGVAGGDGSLGRIAAVALEHGVPFVCVPAGTRNHFARDLGLDRGAPVAALDAFAGHERLVDVGRVGDRVFVNNVSLGAYASLVQRKEYRAHKLGTARAVLPTVVRGGVGGTEMTYRDAAGRVRAETIVLLVANNEYDLQPPFDVGQRRCLDAGVLQVSALLPTSGAGLAAALARATTARRGPNTSVLQWTSDRLRVDGPGAGLPAAIDGEAVVLATPVDFSILPRALRVLVPSTAGTAGRSAFAAFRWRTVRRLWASARGGAGRSD